MVRAEVSPRERAPAFLRRAVLRALLAPEFPGRLNAIDLRVGVVVMTSDQLLLILDRRDQLVVHQRASGDLVRDAVPLIGHRRRLELDPG